MTAAATTITTTNDNDYNNTTTNYNYIIRQKELLKSRDIFKQLRELRDAPVSSINDRIDKLRLDFVAYCTLAVEGYDLDSEFGNSRRRGEREENQKK